MLKRYLVAFVSLFASVAAFATTPTIDTTEALANIGAANTAIAAVGAALIGLAALVLAYKWVKANFF